jgi:hypothetical protein
MYAVHCALHKLYNSTVNCSHYITAKAYTLCKYLCTVHALQNSESSVERTMLGRVCRAHSRAMFEAALPMSLMKW